MHSAPMQPAPFAQSVTFLYAVDPAACRRFYAEVLRLPLVLDQRLCAIFAVAENRPSSASARHEGRAN
ncbi:MAG: glyoxalase/bleomycin resistance/dioxygenase family protein [Rhodospirillales bacterium]|jgi:hypothetical protein|nr:glyoxalase/bleomycin resistance/dioxygenase family protein [Rhodospirillales bacterium]